MSTIRIFSPYFPYPYSEAAFQFILNQALAYVDFGHAVELVCWKDSEAAFNRKAALAREKVENIKIIRWRGEPETRISRAIRAAKGQLGEPASPELFHYPHLCDFRESLNPVDLEIYHYSFAYNWLSRRPSTAKRSVVQFHNLEYQLFNLRAQVEGWPRSIFHNRTARKVKEHEIKITELVSEIWHCSPRDLETFQSALPSLRQNISLVTPTIHQVDVQSRWTSAPPKGSVYRLGIIGGLDFVPNQKSLIWIIENLAPLLKNHAPQFEIVHAGKRNSSIEAAAAKYPFIRFLGFVEDIEAWWKDLSFTLVPDTTGAGIRIKLLESLGSKVPVLATELATTRLPESLRNTPGLFTSNDPRSWLVYMLKSPPFVERQMLRSSEFPLGLEHKQVLGFLRDLG